MRRAAPRPPAAIAPTVVGKLAEKPRVDSVPVPPAAPPPRYVQTVLADRPWGYWRLGDTSGRKAVDASGNGHDGLYVGGPKLGSPGALAGDADRAVAFDGKREYVSPEDKLNASVITVEAWVRIDQPPADTALVVGFVDGEGSGIADKRLVIAADRTIAWHVWDGSDRWTYTARGAMPLGTWTHIAGVADGKSTTLYVNGLAVMSVAAGPTYTKYTGPDVFISGSDSQYSAPSTYLAGQVDDVAVYPSALPAERIAAHYDAARVP